MPSLYTERFDGSAIIRLRIQYNDIETRGEYNG
jgi:hypothetical protein